MFLKYCSGCFVTKEEFEDTNGVIKTRISIEEEQTIPCPKEKYKRKNKDLQNIHIKLKIE
jgi:hypothetical protein